MIKTIEGVRTGYALVNEQGRYLDGGYFWHAQNLESAWVHSLENIISALAEERIQEGRPLQIIPVYANEDGKTFRRDVEDSDVYVSGRTLNDLRKRLSVFEKKSEKGEKN